MPRPFFCPRHGSDAPTRWRRNGATTSGTPKRTRTCVLCHAPRGASLEGRDDCPRCGSRDIVLVRGGRPGQAPYRACRVCRKYRNARYRTRVGTATRAVLDPYLELQIALDSVPPRA